MMYHSFTRAAGKRGRLEKDVAMHDQGFHDSRTVRPFGLGVVIAAHAAVLTAIALAPPEVIRTITFVPTIVESIKAPPPPEVPPPAPRPRQQHATPTTADPLVSTGERGPLVVTLPPSPPSTESRGALQLPSMEPVFVQATIDPGAMARFQPDYPSQLIRADIEGAATVRVLIGDDGRVKAVELVNATDPAFFEATKKQALRFWRFRAATRDGIATESWRIMTVRFTIRG